MKERKVLFRRTDNSSKWNEGVTSRNASPDTPTGVHSNMGVRSSVKSAENNRKEIYNFSRKRLRGELCYLYAGGL